MARHEVREGPTMVVGSKCYGIKPDRRKLYRQAIGVDLFEGEGVDVVHDLETPLPDELGTFAHIDCCSVLEHVKRPWTLCANIERVMMPNATILVMVPFVWRVHAYPDDYWRMTTAALDVLFPDVKWKQRAYLVAGRIRKITPSKDEDHHKYLERSEMVGFGVKCR